MTTMTIGGMQTRPLVRPTPSLQPRSQSTPMVMGCATLSTPTMTMMVGVMLMRVCVKFATLGPLSTQGVLLIPNILFLIINVQLTWNLMNLVYECLAMITIGNTLDFGLTPTPLPSAIIRIITPSFHQVPAVIGVLENLKFTMDTPTHPTIYEFTRHLPQRHRSVHRLNSCRSLAVQAMRRTWLSLPMAPSM